MTYSPIALFVYNRPQHTKQTVEALQKNVLAIQSDLTIFSDAPKIKAQAEAVRNVRKYIHQIDGFKSITIVERETNFGLARSIIEGVTKLCEEYGRVIVLEDDLVTSPYFLQFMNDALDMYEDEDRVMHISGCLYPIGGIKDETFFLRAPFPSGWATWGRAWRHFRKSDNVMLEFDQEMRKAFTLNGTYHSWKQLELNKNGSYDTWFIYWYVSLFLRDGLALFPGKTLIQHIGFDGSGVHCAATNIFDSELSASAIQISPIPIEESKVAVERHENFFRKAFPPVPWHTRIIRKVRRVIGKFVQTIHPDGVDGK